MIQTDPEFSRSYRLSQLRQQSITVSVEADDAERAALVRRFGLVSLGALAARVTLTLEGDDILADGEFTARVEQACVATGDPIPVTLTESISLRFTPEPDYDAMDDARDDEGAEEHDLAETSDDLGERDLIHYQGSSIDIGEAVAETLLLSLDPYPRSPGADAFLKQKGVLSEEESGPFAGLAALKDALKR